MAKNFTFSEKAFRAYIKIRVAVGKAVLDIVVDLKSVSPTSVPFSATIVIFPHLFLNHEGRLGTTDNFTTNFLYCPL